MFCFFVALIGVGFWVFNGINGRRQPVRSGKTDQTLANLQAQLRLTPATPHWIYAVKLGHALRAYTVAKYRLPQDPLAGSGTIFFDSIKQELPAEAASRLLVLLQEVDDMVSRELEHYPDLKGFQADVSQFIDVAHGAP